MVGLNGFKSSANDEVARILEILAKVFLSAKKVDTKRHELRKLIVSCEIG